MQKNNKQENPEQQFQLLTIKSNQKLKKKIINKKHLVPVLIHFPFMFQISDSMFRVINNSNIKNFQNIQKTSEVFFCKTLRSINFQSQNIILNFQIVKQNFKSVQNYIEQFKSLGDDYFYDLAVSYQFFYNKYNMFHQTQSQKQNTQNTTHHQVMEEVLAKIKGKKYLAYFNENIQGQACLSKIIISNQILQATGYKKQELQLDFLKYKHVFFEIVDKEFFQKIYIEFGHYAKKMIQKNGEITIKNQENLHKKNLAVFNDFVYRKKFLESGQQVDEKLNAVIQFYKPHQKITIFEFQIDQEHIISTIPRQKISLQKQKFDEMIKIQQRKSLQHILDKIVLNQQNQ